MTYKIDVWVTHSYGYYEIRFRKVFNLPFVPFIGLILCDNIDDNELMVELRNNEYCSTRIHYHLDINEFEVNIREPWRNPVTDETIDYVISSFTKAGWERKDQTDIADLKKLMTIEHERTNKIQL